MPLHIWLPKHKYIILGGLFVLTGGLFYYILLGNLYLFLLIVNTPFFNNFSVPTNLFFISFIPVKLYSNADSMKINILKENKSKAGVYQ